MCGTMRVAVNGYGVIGTRVRHDRLLMASI